MNLELDTFPKFEAERVFKWDFDASQSSMLAPGEAQPYLNLYSTGVIPPYADVLPNEYRELSYTLAWAQGFKRFLVFSATSSLTQNFQKL